jgi:zinc protease
MAGALITEHRLKNGLRVLLVERHDAPVVASLLYYRVGVRNEREHEAGVSHFLEHMMFKGTAALGKGQIDLITTALGGNNNAWTAHDHTAYWFEFAADRWERALELEADRMLGLMLDEREFEAEKAVVLEELSMTADDPWRELGREVGETLFSGHPYGRPVIGYTDTLRALSVEDMRDYYRRYYHPGNAILVICGDVRPGPALRLVRKHFGGIAPAGLTAEPYRRPPTEPSSEKRVVCRWDDDARRLCMAWPTVAVGSDADYALDILTVVMASGRMSRLYRRLVLDEGLAASISMSNDTRVDGGALWLFAECANGTRPAQLEAAIDEEFEQLSRDLVPARELKRARDMLHAAEAFECETVTDLAEDLGSYAVDADWQLALQSEERLAAIRPGFLRQTVREFLVPKRRVTGWSLPSSAEEEVPGTVTPPVKGRRRSS